MAIGRISGPLLKQNLLREGVNLAFENDLLYLDVNNSRVGINTNSPQYDLDVNGTTRSTSAEIANQADIGGLRILNNNSGRAVSYTEFRRHVFRTSTLVFPACRRPTTVSHSAQVMIKNCYYSPFP